MPPSFSKAHNNHDPRCGRPPQVRNTDEPELYYGYFENYYGEQFVFTFDRATGTGTVSGGDLQWDEPKSFTLELINEALRETRKLAAQIPASAHRGVRPGGDRHRAGVGPPHRSDGEG